ncbi:MAG: hypothetical protein JWO56_2849, partial [Acidobacteria bacterium]|nr:hypothetical protein [Acidobacteriota bacterium]
MASKNSITTPFVITGLTAAVNGVRNFAKQASAALNGTTKSADGLTKGFVGAGSAAAGAGTVMRKSLAGVQAALATIRSMALGVFAVITGAVARMGSIIHGVFLKAAADSSTWFNKVAVSQVGALTGGGLLFKLNLQPGTASRILRIFQGIAARVGTLFSQAISLVNPLSRSGIFGLARRAARAATFAAGPTAAIGAVVNKGVNTIGDTVGSAVAAGLSVPDFSHAEATLRQFGGTGADVTEIMGKFQTAIDDVRENGL